MTEKKDTEGREGGGYRQKRKKIEEIKVGSRR